MVRHPQTGTYRRTRLFVLTLGYVQSAGGSIRIFADTLDHAKSRMREIRKQQRLVPATRPCESDDATPVRRRRAADLSGIRGGSSRSAAFHVVRAPAPRQKYGATGRRRLPLLRNAPNLNATRLKPHPFLLGSDFVEPFRCPF